MSATDLRLDNGKRGSHSNLDTHTAEYLSWRRLHLAKSKLTNVTEMASFMAGFAVVATVELQINDNDIHPPLLIAFVITTSLLVGTCMIAIVISTCVLPHIESVAKTSDISGANQSPHDKMRRLIDISWVLTNSASLFFFTLDVILMCWIKYTYFTIGASIAATVIMAPVLVIILVFAAVFYRKIVKHQYVISSMKYEELERMHKQLERASSLTSMSYQGTITSNNLSVGGTGTPNNLKKQWTLYQQQQQQQNHQNYNIPHSYGSSKNPSPPLQHPRQHQSPHYYTNRPFQFHQRQFSHPDHLPFNFSMNPNGSAGTRMATSNTPPSMPLSPSASNHSISPSVLTV